MSNPLTHRRLYLCTPDRPDLGRFVADCIDGGVDVVQLRDKSLGARDLLDRAAVVRSVCSDLGVPFVLNDRPDLALEAGADGVHVGQDDAPPALARKILGPDALVGLSTHSLDDLERARHEPVDYFSAGPVVRTPTKPGRSGTGLGYAATATARSDRPVFVTGGVSPDTVPAMAAAGVRQFVVVRCLTMASTARAAAAALRKAIDEAVDRVQAGTGDPAL